MAPSPLLEFGQAGESLPSSRELRPKFHYLPGLGVIICEMGMVRALSSQIPFSELNEKMHTKYESGGEAVRLCLAGLCGEWD